MSSIHNLKEIVLDEIYEALPYLEDYGRENNELLNILYEDKIIFDDDLQRVFRKKGQEHRFDCLKEELLNPGQDPMTIRYKGYDPHPDCCSH